MSTRAIAPAVGVSNYTVSKDRQQGEVLDPLTPEPAEHIDHATGEVLDTPTTNYNTVPEHWLSVGRGYNQRMGLLIGLVVLLLVGGLMLFGVLAVGGIVVASRKDKALANDADRIMRDLFNGDPQVSYTRSIVGLPNATLLTGAARHGYTLTTSAADNKYSTTLVFTRQSSSVDRSTK